MHRLRGGQRILYHGCVVGHGQDRASFHGDRSRERKWLMLCQRLQSLTNGRKLSKNPPAQRRVCATVTIMRSLEQAGHNAPMRRRVVFLLFPELEGNRTARDMLAIISQVIGMQYLIILGTNTQSFK